MFYYSKFPLLVCLFLFFISCSKYDYTFIRDLLPEEQLKVSDFELKYIERIKLDTKTKSESFSDVALVGYKTISYHGHDSVFVNMLWEKHKDEITAFGSFLTLDGQARIYFPMSDAIVRINGKKYIADSKGVVSLPSSDLEKVSVVGREKTDKTVSTVFGHTYWPEDSFNQSRVLIFDLGLRPTCCSKDMHNPEKLTNGEGGGGGVPCTQNHGSYPNCTAAFMIAQPRCVTRYDRCMDYNGYGSDCSGSELYFLGSDCSVAMSRGYCWNELMD